MSLLEVIAVIISVIGVVLTIQRHIWCWPINFIAYLLYAKLFFDFKLYGETVLQIVFMALAIYGFYVWKTNSDVDLKFKVLRIENSKLQWHLLFSCISGLVFGWLLHSFTDAAVPYLDAQLACFSLLATYWTSKRYLEVWHTWIIVDIIYVGMFIYKALYLTAGLYALFVGLAVAGLYEWKRHLLIQSK